MANEEEIASIRPPESVLITVLRCKNLVGSTVKLFELTFRNCTCISVLCGIMATLWLSYLQDRVILHELAINYTQRTIYSEKVTL